MMVAVFDVTFRNGERFRLNCPITGDERRELQSHPNPALMHDLIERTLNQERQAHELGLSAADVKGWTSVGIKQSASQGIHRDIVARRNAVAHRWRTANEQSIEHEEATTEETVTVADEKNQRTVARSRSLLQLGNRLLPVAIRDEALDEWMDEIECAAAQDLPVFPRVRSILFRSLPRLAWRSRRPERARQGGS